MTHLKRLQLTLLLIIFASAIACKKNMEQQPVSQTELNPYVYAYTSGVISRAAPLKIQFTQEVATEEEVGKEAPQALIQLNPATPGKLYWEDNRSLRFQPDGYFREATSYRATINLKSIIPDARKNNRTFSFSFQTLEQGMQLTLEGLQAAQVTDLSKQELKGVVYTFDVAEASEVESSLKAIQNRSDLLIQWNHATDQRAHSFTVQDIQRGEQDSEVRLQLNGKPLGVDQDEQKTLQVPSLNKFVITRAEVVADAPHYLRVLFSDPIEKDQELEGLLRLQGYEGGFNFLIDGQEVRLYPREPLNGRFRLIAETGIRNLARRNMSEPSVWDIRFADVKPQVRIAGSGAILPSTEGMVFPFEAIGLRTVEVEVFKIFNNNILQFLQNNQLDGQSNIYQVGRIIHREEIDLQHLNPEAGPRQWARYGLNISSMVDEDPEAIYQIRIGFRPQYAVLNCGGASFPEEPTHLNEEDGERRSMMDSYYSIYGYTNNFNWERRDDPCAMEYYNSQRFISQNVIASNLGLIAKKGAEDEVLTIVTDLRNAQPVSGAELEFYDYQQQLIGKARTEADGTVWAHMDGKPFVLLARYQNQRGYLRIMDGDALNMSRFDVAGAPVQKGLKGFLYGDRGVWRPGDSVYLNFILDDKENPLPADYPLTFELYDARNRQVIKRVSSKNINRLYPLHFATAADAPTGNWRAVVKAGGASFEKTIPVETVRPNRMSIDLGFGSPLLSTTMEPLEGQLRVHWLHGAPAAGLKAQVEGRLSSGETTFDKYPTFTFEDPARRYSQNGMRTLFEGQLNSAGQASFTSQLLGEQAAPGRLRASFRTRVFEAGGGFSTDYFSLPYETFQTYAGLEIPLNQYGEPRIEVGSKGLIRLLTVDTSGTPVPNRKLSLGMYRLDWRWWWDEGEDYVSRYNSSNHYNALEKASLTTDQNGQATWELNPKDWGRYLIRVCEEGGHCSGSYLYAGYPWYGEENNDQMNEIASLLQLTTDKESYVVGDKATLKIPAGQNGKALLSLETGSRVISTQWLETSQGENTVSFDITPEMAPTVYAHLSLIQAHGQVENDLPIRLYGVSPIQVENPNTRLEPEITMAEELRPLQTASITVKEAKGRPMAYTIALVDEGLLGLTRFQTPDPHAAIYAREALGVHTWDIYNEVLNTQSGTLERVLTIGGDGALAEEVSNSANRFEPVVRHLGPFQLKKGSKAVHNIEIPNYIGAVRAMVVAAQDGAYGSTSKSVPVRNPLMVLADLPRTLGPGEQLQLPVNVFVSDEAIQRVQVKLSESSGLIKMPTTSKNLSIQKTGDQLVSFDLQVGDQTGIARFTIEATGGGHNSSQEIEIAIRNPNPFNTVNYSGVIEAGANWSQDFRAIGMEGTRSATLEVSGIPPLNLGRRLKYLLRYPYGCLEQTTSSAFPQLYVGRLLQMDEAETQQVNRNIIAAIDRIRTFQTGTGGFAYWPGQGQTDAWSTTYAGHFLLEARKQGYVVPETMIQDFVNHQKKAARLWDERSSGYGGGTRRAHQLQQAYRLYTLALAASPDMGSMNRLREVSALEPQARWRLAAAYALAGRKEVARELIADQSIKVEPYTELSYTYGSALRDQAMMLETLLEIDDQDQAGRLLMDLSTQLSSDQWHSTQSVAYALMAAAKYVGEDATAEPFRFEWQLDGRQAVSAGSQEAVMQIQLPEPEGNEQITVRNNGNQKIFVQLTIEGQPSPGDEQPGSSYLAIETRFFNREGEVLDPGALPRGTDLTARVSIRHTNERPFTFDELALTQIFPSGWEISNARMYDTTNDSAADPFDYQDIRDDRVNTFFDLGPGKTHYYSVQVNATYPGRYYLPGTDCSAMYDKSIYAREMGQWVSVVDDEIE